MEHSVPLNRHRGHRSTDIGDIGQPTSGMSVEGSKNNGTVCFSGTCFNPLRFTRGIRVAEDLEFQYKYLTLCQHPVKVDVVLYYYRLRETSVTGDAVYRQRAVEDLPVVLKNLAAWSKENDVKPEPWYDYRIMKLLQNLLYSASLVQNLDTRDFQRTIRDVVAVYKRQDFLFVQNKKICLATWSVKAYFLFNKYYLKLKGIK